jgi:hypothetical protein
MRSYRAIAILGSVAVAVMVAGTSVSLAIANGQELQARIDADSDEHRGAQACSVSQVRGAYGFEVTGVAFKPDGSHGDEFATGGVQTLEASGLTHGTVTGTNSQFGLAVGSFTGTFTIDANCTGSEDLTVHFTQPAALAGATTHAKFELVVVENGRRILAHGTEPASNTVEHGSLFRL